MNCFEIAIARDARLNLHFVRYFIEKTNESYGLPLSFNENQNALLLFHPDHPNDYFNFVLTLTAQGNAMIIRCEATGKSKQFKKKAAYDASRDSLKTGYWGSQLGLENASEFYLRSGIYSVRSFGYSEENLRKEESYYSTLLSLIKATFNAN